MRIDHVVEALAGVGITISGEDRRRLGARLSADAALLQLLNDFDGVDVPPAIRPPWDQRELGDTSEQTAVPEQSESERAHSPRDDGADEFEELVLSPVEHVRGCLTAIQASPQAHVFIDVFADQALREAEEWERVSSADRASLPLWGKTVAVKDIMAIRNHTMTAGACSLSQAPATEDALVVSRLRRAGAIIVGAANLHEFAFGTTSLNPHFGSVQNPRDPERLAGGSSGGSAAAVGFGMADIGIGTDTGGSVRIPAACCGLVGIKPSYGLVPLSGVFPLGYSLDHVGPIVRTVHDAAVVLEVLADRPGAFVHQVRQDASPNSLRVGIPTGHFDLMEREVAAAFDRAVVRLAEAGVKVERVELPRHEPAPAVYFATSGPEAAAVHAPRLRSHPECLGEDVRVRLMASALVPAFSRVKAQQLRWLMAEELRAMFKSVDVLLAPTLPILPPSASTEIVEFGNRTMPSGSAFLYHTSPFNLTGVPALTLPYVEQGKFPVGVQVVGPHGRDDLVLRAGRIIERELGCQ